MQCGKLSVSKFLDKHKLVSNSMDTGWKSDRRDFEHRNPLPQPGRYVALHPPRLKNVTALPLRLDHFVRDAYVRWSLSAPLFRAAFGFCGFQALSRGTSLDFTQGKAALLLAPPIPRSDS